MHTRAAASYVTDRSIIRPVLPASAQANWTHSARYRSPFDSGRQKGLQLRVHTVYTNTNPVAMLVRNSRCVCSYLMEHFLCVTARIQFVRPWPRVMLPCARPSRSLDPLRPAQGQEYHQVPQSSCVEVHVHIGSCSQLCAPAHLGTCQPICHWQFCQALTGEWPLFTFVLRATTVCHA